MRSIAVALYIALALSLFFCFFTALLVAAYDDYRFCRLRWREKLARSPNVNDQSFAWFCLSSARFYVPPWATYLLKYNTGASERTGPRSWFLASWAVGFILLLLEHP